MEEPNQTSGRLEPLLDREVECSSSFVADEPGCVLTGRNGGVDLAQRGVYFVTESARTTRVGDVNRRQGPPNGVRRMASTLSSIRRGYSFAVLHDHADAPQR